MIDLVNEAIRLVEDAAMRIPSQSGCAALMSEARRLRDKRDAQAKLFVIVDEERINWLEENPDRLEDVRGRVNNEDVTVREAIDWFQQRARDEAAMKDQGR